MDGGRVADVWRLSGVAALKKYALSIPEGAIPERADRVLARLLPGMPAYRVREAFRKRDVKCNGRRIAPDSVVSAGDALLVYLDAPGETQLEIVGEDEQYLVVNKRQGIPVQGEGSLEALCARHAGAPVFACHRLDVMTGGLTLLAKTEAALKDAEEAFAARLVRKVYRAQVRGCPEPKEAALHAYLRKDAGAATVRVTDRPQPGALPIETRYRVVTPGGDISRVEIDLITGRTHQIRAHMASIGHPILGDDKYGDRALNRAHGARRQRLWAVGLTLWDGRAFSVEEPF